MAAAPEEIAFSDGQNEYDGFAAFFARESRDGLVVAADRTIHRARFLRDRARRIKCRLLGRHIPAFPGDTGDRPSGG